MSLPKFILYTESIIFLFFSQLVFSQKDSTKKWIRFSANAGLIVNSTFSDYKNAQYNDDPFFGNKFYVTKNKKAPEYSSGYFFGASCLLGKSWNHNFLIGISISHTRSLRHESTYRRPHSLGPYYNYTHTEVDFLLKTFYANIELGYKFRLIKKLFLQPSLICHYNIHTKETQTGFMEVDERHSGGYQSFVASFTTSNIDETKTYDGQKHGSFRITAFYQFNLNKRIYEVFAFKSWGIKYHLPWGGIGASTFF